MMQIRSHVTVSDQYDPPFYEINRMQLNSHATDWKSIISTFIKKVPNSSNPAKKFENVYVHQLG